MTNSERIVVTTWRNELERQTSGCDFIESCSKTPIEVKANIFSKKQVNEMVYNHLIGKSPILVAVTKDSLLVFTLQEVLPHHPMTEIVSNPYEPEHETYDRQCIDTKIRCLVCDGYLQVVVSSHWGGAHKHPFCPKCRYLVPFLDVEEWGQEYAIIFSHKRKFHVDYTWRLMFSEDVDNRT